MRVVRPGETVWFEYHCWEDDRSSDATIWHRSHEQVTVLSVVNRGYGRTPAERNSNGEPRVFRVRWIDGLEWDVFEDELFRAQSGFFRPDPPGKSTTTSAHEFA